MTALKNRAVLEQRVYEYLEDQIQTLIDRGELSEHAAFVQQLSALINASPTPVDWPYLTNCNGARSTSQWWRLAVRERIKLFHIDGLKSVNTTQRLWRKEKEFA